MHIGKKWRILKVKELVMKKILMGLVILTMFLGALGVHAGEGWTTDFEKAKVTAKEKNVPILADFSGSDWCGWCIKLDKEVFSQKEFKAYAAENVVLFLADFPNRKKMDPEVVKQNEKLAKI